MIREITPLDAEQWSDMRSDLWPDTDDGHRAEIARFFEVGLPNLKMVYIALLETRLVGFIELNLRPYAEGSQAEHVPYVEGWYVRPEQQGKGIGSLLMRRAEQWALDQGFNELASDAEIENIRSIELHKKNGFVETDRVVCFLKTLKSS